MPKYTGMGLRALFAAMLLLIGMSVPAFAAFTVTHKGTNSVGTGTTVSVTALTVSNGDLILVGGAVRLAASTDVLTLSDTAGDTFTFYENPSGGTNAIRSFIGFVKTTGLSGGSVTLTSSGGNVLMMALSVETVSGYDTTTIEDTTVKAQSNATSTTPNVTSGTPTYSGDLFYSSFQVGNVTYTEDATWTNTGLNLGNTNAKADTGYFIGSGTSTATRTGSTASSQWRSLIIGIKAAGAAPSGAGQGLSLLGVTN